MQQKSALDTTLGLCLGVLAGSRETGQGHLSMHISNTTAEFCPTV